MATKKKMLQAAAGVGGEPEGAWDLSYAYYDDPLAWDISTAEYTSKSFSIRPQETTPEALSFKPDGTKMYVAGRYNDNVSEYDLSTAWDVTTASFVQSASVASDPRAVFFSPDGTKMYIGRSSQVSQYTLTTPWDVSTSSLLQSFSVSSQESLVQGLFFKPDGAKMYVLGSSGDDVNEYNLSTAWDVSTASYVQNFSVASQDVYPQGLSFKADGTKMYVLGNDGGDVNEYSLSTAWDVSTASYVQRFIVSPQEASPTEIFFKPDGSGFYIVGVSEDTVYQYTLGGFSVFNKESNSTDLFFKLDGTEMYIIGTSGDDVNQYSLSTAWDTSTATYTRVFDTGTVTTAPQGLFFKPDGTTLYTIGSTTDAVSQWSLSVPWDISSTSYVRQFSVSAQDSFPTSITFKPDGAKMYMLGGTGDNVYEYDLSTAWDVSTASYVQSFDISGQENNPHGLFIKPDGTKMYICGSSGDDVNEYDLSTAWDVTTASYVQNFSVSGQGSFPYGVFFHPDGVQMFITQSDTDKVFTYSLGVQE